MIALCSALIAFFSARTSRVQAQASRRPYINPVTEREKYEDLDQIFFVNTGAGPANKMTISYFGHNGLHASHYNGSVGVGERFFACVDEGKFVNYADMTAGTLEFAYSDVAGKKYRTTVRLEKNNFFTEMEEA